MPGKCQVCGKLQSKQDSTRSYHRWPEGVETRKEWMQYLGISSINASLKYICICSDHFSNEDFDVQNYGTTTRKFLKENAKPQRYVIEGKLLQEVQTTSTCNIESIPDVLESTATTMTIEKGEFSTERDRSAASSTTGSDIEPLPFDTPSPLHKKRKIDTLTTLDVLQSVSSIKKKLWTDSAETITVSSSATLTASTSDTLTAGSDVIDEQEPCTSWYQQKEKAVVHAAIPCKPVKTRKRVFKRYVGEMTSNDFSSPRRAKKYISLIKTKVTSLSTKIKSLQKTKNRQKARIHSLKTLLKYLKDKNFISIPAEHNIQESLADNSALVGKLLQGPRKQKFCPELRSFAMTLHFYSPKAYQYVRQKFNKTLPHPSTISKWYSHLDGKPGFTQESITALQVKVEEARKTGFQILCSLVFDEVAIRRQVEWDGRQYYGFIDIGTKIDSDCIPEATEALVLMAVGMNTDWKIPIGYFLINGLTGQEKANLVNKSLEFLAQADLRICSLTCDGAPANFIMASCLGADYSDPNNLKTYFFHPVHKYKIYFIMDPSHMIKLVRNCLGSYSILETSTGNKICWQYLKSLVEVQTKEGLSAANKLKKRHVHYYKEKMKVKLAAQTLSKSVADALGFLREDVAEVDIKKKFFNSEATEEFLMIFNDCFDIMNSSSRYSTYKYKKALSPQTEEYIFERLSQIHNYILNLNYAGKSVLRSGRKCGFLGLLINIKSIQGVYNDLVKANSPKLKYLLTYKLSQDHLEIFFSAIRRKGGDNNNPTAKQFQNTYKKLLIHIEIKGADTGNATAIDNTSVLHCSSVTRRITETVNGEDLLLSEDHLREEQLINQLEFINSSAWHLTTYSEDVVQYISGFVGRTLQKCVSCGRCLELLLSPYTHSSLLEKRKTYEHANMYSSSKLLIELCVLGERHFRVILNEIGIFNKRVENIVEILIRATFKNVSSNIMNLFGNHVFDFEPLTTHFTELIKLILKKYFNIRIHHETKKKLDDNIGTRVRSILTKTVIFRHQ